MAGTATPTSAEVDDRGALLGIRRRCKLSRRMRVRGATEALRHSPRNSCFKARCVRLRPPGALLLGLAALAQGHDFRRVDGVAVDLHFDDFAALVDEIVDAASCFVLGIVKTVLPGDVTAPIAQEGKGDSDFLCPRGVAEGAVHTNTQDLGVCSFQLCQVLLEVLHLLGSTTCEGEDVKGESDVFLAAEVMQGHLVAMGVHQREVRRHVPDLDGGIGHGVFLFRLCRQAVPGAWGHDTDYPQQQDTNGFTHTNGPPQSLPRGPARSAGGSAIIPAVWSPENKFSFYGRSVFGTPVACSRHWSGRSISESARFDGTKRRIGQSI